MSLNELIEEHHERILWQANRIKFSNGASDRCLIPLVEWFARTFWKELPNETTFGDLKTLLAPYCD